MHEYLERRFIEECDHGWGHPCPDCEILWDIDETQIIVHSLSEATVRCPICEKELGDKLHRQPNADEMAARQIAAGNLPPKLKHRLGLCAEPGCARPADEDFIYPDGTPAELCWEHAKGIFCLGCGSFTAGTEEAFIYGHYRCSDCAHHDDDAWEDDWADEGGIYPEEWQLAEDEVCPDCQHTEDAYYNANEIPF